jgi:predicted hotdog family 3-hydroxylacyl-ACP dehydratase
MTHDEICTRIPHKGRMCLLAQLEHWDDTRIVCLALNQGDADHPLRTSAGLHALCAIEYAAQAMALHGSMRAPQGPVAAVGYLASVRDVQLDREWLDREDGPLRIEAERLGGDDRAFVYAFSVSSRAGRVASGRVAVQQHAGARSL